MSALQYTRRMASVYEAFDWMLPGQVQQMETIIFAITGKILYIDTPMKGEIHFNDTVKHAPELVLGIPMARDGCLN